MTITASFAGNHAIPVSIALEDEPLEHRDQLLECKVSGGRGVRNLPLVSRSGPASCNHAIVARYVDVGPSDDRSFNVRGLYALNFAPLLNAGERPQHRENT